MSVFLYLEASQPCGTRYRFGLGCQVPPSLVSMMVVNRHRSGTPLLTRFNALIYKPKFRSGWGPDRRRSGPYPHIDFRSKFKAIAQFRPGSHFGADSHLEDPSADKLGPVDVGIIH